MPTFHNRLFSSYLRAPWMLCAYENTQMLAQVWARQKFSRHSTTTSSSSLFAYFFRSPQGKLAHTKQTIKRAIWTRLSLILFCLHKYGPTLPLSLSLPLSPTLTHTHSHNFFPRYTQTHSLSHFFPEIDERKARVNEREWEDEAFSNTPFNVTLAVRESVLQWTTIKDRLRMKMKQNVVWELLSPHYYLFSWAFLFLIVQRRCWYYLTKDIARPVEVTQ